MLDGLRDAGCRIIYTSDPREAPFVMSFETRAGERLGVVAYAFTATRTPTKNRPSDERSFQIKYGSKESYEANSHELWQDPLGLFTTLLIGINPDAGFFVAADPEHNPTKFFIRLEFKDRHADAIKRDGWYAWERDRRGEMPEPIEVLVGGAKGRFLDLVLFERAAKGLSPGDRQLLAERRELFTGVDSLDPSAAADEKAALHPLASEFELAPEQILELIAGARRLKMAVRGWVAEEKLRDTLSAVPGVTWVERLDEEGGPDLRVRWKGGPPLTVECKNVLRKTNAGGIPRIDFQRTRASKEDPCSRYYSPADFDVVAGCLHAVSERWEFRYVRPIALEAHTKCLGKLASNVLVGKLWSAEPGPVFESAYAGLA
jgi:hypothetical protein